MDPEPAENDDLSTMEMDTEPVKHDYPGPTESDSEFCINCGSAGASMLLQDEQIFQCIRQWIAPRLVQEYNLICLECWYEAKNMHSIVRNFERNCVLCNVALPVRTRSHQVIGLRTDTQHHVNIKNIVIERLMPQQACASHFICHPCWQRADRAAKHYSTPSTSCVIATSQRSFRCANCAINLHRITRHILHNETILNLVQQQAATRMVTATDYICDACHTIFNERLVRADDDTLQNTSPTVGHEATCVECGCSVARVRSHIVQESNHICHRCFLRVQNSADSHPVVPADVPADVLADVPADVPPDVPADIPVDAHADAVVDAPANGPAAPQPALSITLPNYKRAPVSHARCIFLRCTNTSHVMVPLIVRVNLIKNHNYYIPPECRICRSHLQAQSWTALIDGQNANHNFTAAHIEDLIKLLKNEKIGLDFNDIENMDDHVVWYFLGRTKEQFGDLLAVLPDFLNKKIALGAYLLKLRTGDSDERISSLLNISRSTLNRLLNRARNTMTDYFVPLHLGLNHLPRRRVPERNLYIPESLFGNPGSAMENRKAIVIMDGTYTYIQKSSNYSYQKKTYSPHKYRNLVKPFLIVCCDGYIVDARGPFAATKSDADILTDEFSDPQKPLRQYFREGDVFILDRGFRDCISLLQGLNYSVHYPLSLQQGESQMSTQNANESRKVTICRWVVEVVNGRFKRDFKLLRQEFCNKASKHLMKDFRVAAALLNRFHPVLVDRDDARDIVSIIQEKMFLTNSLADFVDSNNLNRRRAQFENIIVEADNLNDFPRMQLNDLVLIPLGIYQIKKARSYYGEHVRLEGSYNIEVCREVDDDLMQELEVIENNVWLLRGKIKSRHISHKKYFVYILINSNYMGRNAIRQYYCNCIAGRRTVGCCAHIMSIIWYLSWARYQPNINPPAQFLDNILVQNVNDN